MRHGKLIVAGIATLALCLANPTFRERVLGIKAPAPAEATKGPAPALYANAKVVMYSLTTCPHCKVLRAELIRIGVPFTEAFLDSSETSSREFMEILAANGVQGGVGTPSLVVNGKLMLNNPSVSSILLELHNSKG